MRSLLFMVFERKREKEKDEFVNDGTVPSLIVSRGPFTIVINSWTGNEEEGRPVQD